MNLIGSNPAMGGAYGGFNVNAFRATPAPVQPQQAPAEAPIEPQGPTESFDFQGGVGASDLPDAGFAAEPLVDSAPVDSGDDFMSSDADTPESFQTSMGTSVETNSSGALMEFDNSFPSLSLGSDNDSSSSEPVKDPMGFDFAAWAGVSDVGAIAGVGAGDSSTAP